MSAPADLRALVELRAIEPPLPDLTRERAWRHLERRIAETDVAAPVRVARPVRARRRVVIAAVAVVAASIGLLGARALAPRSSDAVVPTASSLAATPAPSAAAQVTVARIDTLEVRAGERVVRDWRGARFTVIGPAEVDLVDGARGLARVRRGLMVADPLDASPAIDVVLDGVGRSLTAALAVRVIDQRTEIAVGKVGIASFVERFEDELTAPSAPPAKPGAIADARRPGRGAELAEPDPAELYERAEQLMRAGDRTGARALLARVVASRVPRLADGARIDLARLALAAGGADEARRWLDGVEATAGTALAVAAARLRAQLDAP